MFALKLVFVEAPALVAAIAQLLAPIGPFVVGCRESVVGLK